MKEIAEFADIDAAAFRDRILPRYEPAVLRGVVRDWPSVRAGVDSADGLMRYLAARDTGTPVDVLLAPPKSGGRIGYADDWSGFSFVRNQVPVSRVLEQIARYGRFETAPAVAIQSALIDDCLPGLAAEQRLDLLSTAVRPRIWIGNAISTPAHFDESSNIACVVGGRRRFTIMPPDQIGNLYIGPFDPAPTGTPISLVDFAEPDFERFPRFRAALDAAQVAELGPGDAIYIPPLWWHHVASLMPFNVLVNYWWKGSPSSPVDRASVQDSLLHSLLDLKDLPPTERAAWGAVFGHYLFDPASDPVGHIPPALRGVLGALTPERESAVRAYLAARLGAKISSA